MQLKAFFNGITVTLWLLAGVYLAILASWSVDANWLQVLHRQVMRELVTAPAASYAEIVARHELEQDFESTGRALQELAAELDGVRKNDALDATKRTVLSQLVWIAERQGNLDLALQWSQRWLAYDPRDINALLANAGILMSLPDRQPEGEAIYLRMMGRFPELLSVRSAYARSLAIDRRLREAFALFLPFLPNTPAQPLIRKIGSSPVLDWDISVYQGDEKYLRKIWNITDRGDYWEFTLLPGYPVDKLHLQFPESTTLAVVEISQRTEAGVVRFDPGLIETEGMELVKGIYYKPRFNWAHLKMTVGSSRDTAIFHPLHLKVRITAPQILRQLVTPPVSTLLEQQLTGDQSQLESGQLLNDYRLFSKFLANPEGVR